MMANKMKMRRKAALLVFSAICAIGLAGCADDQAVLNGKVDAYNELAETALEMAEQMATAVMFDLVTDEVVALSGEAVKAYPHQLLLNNFAAMMEDRGQTEEALELVLLALRQQPEHPVLLTNAANLYLDLENYAAAAEEYAAKALRSGGEFGPAYQVLTTVHLHNNNSELAAETMIKSARHVFNDVSVHHFESFLDEVSRLDPAKDEYPLSEAFIDELYEIARANVDTANVFEGVDTPEGQIGLKPFPRFESASLTHAKAYLDKEIQTLELAKLQASQAQRTASGKEEEGDASSGKFFFPFEYNLRQIYAYEVLESYYKFKVAQVLNRYDQLNHQLRVARHAQYDVYSQHYEDRYEELREKVMNDPLSFHPNILLEIELDYLTKKYKYMRQDADILLGEARKIYDETGQLLEEFWLKSGGLLKYMVEPDYVSKTERKTGMVRLRYHRASTL